ncbi:retinitis pigmentosa 1-like 1 protein [Mastacembelus armatus]|uniref:retinitis pigmentosa 1-like 1 protein n=1 Tax=Mastacembelus armatus TaxID=205130 RepID=UPI000E45406B|nr:retinitis pigmentosa 1-like 1 protein [Mastacembelus armatus]
MHSVQTGMWDPQPPSKHASPIPVSTPFNFRHTHVTTAPPAKRITFYKSGDSQFGGIRMAIHKRSFKCFDALLDDLSQKVPLPFGVRTVTTPRGTHTIRQLEQLQDGGCYLCSDRHQVKPINMELANKRPSIWHHHSRRPQRPETSSTTPPGHLSYTQRRILLVKNSEPGMRRSVVLSRRSARSLRAFLEEVSEVMQFHVRKLYTAEGRRIDSVQSLMTCPGVLVCVGREAFSPVLVNFIRKSSEEKLPGLGPRTPGNGARSPAIQGARSPPHGAQSRASEYSEGHDSKKNVNFGLETKKSIIHPRSDSSNRSTRFSLSSEKSYNNGVSAYSQARPAIMNDDIEKRVLVNKDGSLSVEMRVRFRLHNEESIQWSTQIKKSPSLTDSSPLSQAQPHYLQQGQSESCSDPDSTSFETEAVDYSKQLLQCAIEANHCPCCYQRQGQRYDLWENPVHSYKQPPVPPQHPHKPSHSQTVMRHTHSSSSSSSCNSRRIVRCRAQLSSCRGGSDTEQSHLVQEEMCVTEQVEHRVEMEQDGDTHVEMCRVSRCCSRSEVVTMDSNLGPLSRKSVEADDELMIEGEGERPLSAVSSSSHVLQSLKEDQDDEDEDDDLPPSASQCSHGNKPLPSPTSQNDKPTSNISTVDDHEEIKRVVSGLSVHTELSAGSHKSGTSSVCPNCGGCKRGVNSDSESMSAHQAHQGSPNPASPLSNQENANNGSGNDASDDSDSTHSNKTNLTDHGRISATSNFPGGRASSAMSKCSIPEPEVNEEQRAPSATSHSSNKSHKCGCNSASRVIAEKEERSPRALSAQSNFSAKSSKSTKSNSSRPAEATDIRTKEGAEGDNVVERAMSSMSAKSGVSAKTAASVNSQKSQCLNTAGVCDHTVTEEGETNERAPSSFSVKSNTSAKSGKASGAITAQSNGTAKSSSICSHCEIGIYTGDKVAVIKATEQDEEERATSPSSAKSNLSVKSNKSHKSTKASERSLSPRPEAKSDGEERATSQMSVRSVKSNMSVKSAKPCESNCNGNETAACPNLNLAGDSEDKDNELVEAETQQRSESVMSAKSEKEERTASAISSRSHIFDCNGNTEADEQREDSTEEGEKAKDHAASDLAGTSTKSHHTEFDDLVERTPSAMSGKSHTSAKSFKSRTTATPNPNEADVLSVGANGEERPNENEELVSSAMSVKSKSSQRSKSSQKSSTSLRLNSGKTFQTVSPSSNVITFKAPEGVDEEGNEETERPLSGASAKSRKSNVSSHNQTAGGATDEDETVVGDNVSISEVSEDIHDQRLSPRKTHPPQTHSPKAQLLPDPDGETRGSTALSVHSTASNKSGRPKCRCGKASALGKSKKEKEGEDKEVEKKEENEDVKSEASEQAGSIISSSSKRQRRPTGGTEQPLSRNSSGSVSLGLPEDQDTADSDSGKSRISFHTNTESKGRMKTVSPDVHKSTESSSMKKGADGIVSPVSQKSKSNKSKSTLSHNPPAVDIPTIETPGCEDEGGEQNAERAASGFSTISSRTHKSSCNCSPKKEHASASPTKAENDLETESVNSASPTKPRDLDTPDNRTLSAMSSASAKVQSASTNDDTHANKPASKAKGDDNITESNTTSSVHSKSPCSLRPQSEASVQSGSKMKASKKSKEETSVKLDCLNSVKGHKAKSSVGSNSGNVKKSKSQKKKTTIEPSGPDPLHNSRPCGKVETRSESALSYSLSAADLLKETMAVARPQSCQSKASKSSNKPRSEKSSRYQGSGNQMFQQEELELAPACLPNASPSEVISEWLRSIPDSSSMLALDDELYDTDQEKEMEEKPEKESTTTEECPANDKVDEEEKSNPEEEEETAGETKCDEEEEKKSSDPASHEVGTPSHPNALLLSGEIFPKNWHSSAAVMKVLLSSSLGRCRSMPEVSPVYGRRLSTSARGLLDCLAQLQLIEPTVSPGYDQHKDRSQQYEDIMAILQSLWLTNPRDPEAKDAGIEQVTPPWSSSGVDMSSGSGGSGKDNGNQEGDETPPKETESLHEDEAAEKVVEEEVEVSNAENIDKEMETEPEETSTEQATKDIVEEHVKSEQESTDPPSADSTGAIEDPPSPDKSSANDSYKSPTDNEQDTLEDTSSGTPPTVLRAPLSKRLSQDPDPIWVLHLLKKLEKQFMNHYTDAMTEFKVRWDLNDSLILDKMILELRDEVSRRIQGSIEREMRKIQCRAGKGGRSPRPPQGGNLSRESTITEKRRQMLKVMKNQSVKTADSVSDEDMTGEFSDQRSDDDYCPCDACIRKKMAARPFKTNPMAAEAPVMKEFDLLKILQLKKSPSPAPTAVPEPAEVEDDTMVTAEEGRSLDVVREEEEEDETKEDIKADVVLEETIPEEDEVTGQGENGCEAGEEQEVENENEGNSSVEEQKEKETGGEEVEEEEEGENGEEREAECQCHSVRNEDNDKADEGEGETEEAEDETVDDEERPGEEEDEGETGTREDESDKETVKIATGETFENREGEEEEAAGVEEGEVSDFIADEEETTGRESGEEEASGETEGDNAGKTATNEELTLVEEFAEENVGASADAEEEGDDSTREEGSQEDNKGGESEEQEGEVSEGERTSPPQAEGLAPAVCVTEGEEADAEDSDAESKCPGDSGVDEQGQKDVGSTEDEEAEDGGGGGEEEEVLEEDVVEDLNPDEEDEEEVNRNQGEDGALLHQFTRTSMESQPGSLEDIDRDSPQTSVNSTELPQTADAVSTGGGTGQRRSCSQARVRRHKPKESDVELDNV